MSGSLNDSLFAWAFEHSDCALIGVDEAKTVRTWTKGATALLGTAREDAVGRPFSELFAHPGDCDRFLKAAAAVPVVRNLETVFAGKAGGRTRVFLTLTAFQEGGWLASLTPAVVDFDVAPEHKAVREALVRMERFCAVGRMTAAFTHQMRTPLHVISSTVEFAIEFLNPDGKMRECLEMVQRNVAQATESVKSLLDFAKAGRPQLVESQLNDTVRASVQPLEKLCASRGISLKVEFGEPPIVLLDPPQIRAVVQNVLVNAIEASKEGGTVEVRTSATAEGGAQVVVRDSGAGMPPEVLVQASAPFFTTKEHGTGLGLYLSKRVLAEHGGTLHLDSMPGRGTSATIRFAPPARGS
jgi:signal transduction histidine kinase